ncbi:MAG: hypothetical protein L3J36_09915 [Rhodobacteraceae bacterium]|nr:hypothetical protein [Paracoccaceae bacterium]
MSMAGSFLGGAKNRLLPASVPFRFFLAASGFQVLAWAMLFVGAPDLAGYAGGTGPVLAAIHLLTLGVLVLCAMGASYQLLPVVTRRPMARTWPARLSFWFVAPGTLLLAYGMANAALPALFSGGGLVSAGLLVFAILTGNNLWRAGNMAVVAAHGWGALVALAGFVAIGVLLIADFQFGLLTERREMALVHMILASFGFMGLLVLGLSQVLIPMFVLSRGLPARLGWAQLATGIAALGLVGAGVLMQNPGLMIAGFVPGIGAVIAHFAAMRTAFRTGMRKRLGLSFILIRASWRFLGLGLLIGLALVLGLALPGGPALFGFVVLAGWLLTFLTGILQRIMPFLASMHASGHAGVPALLSDLTAEFPLRIHAVCHFAALTLVMAGIVFDLTLSIRIGAALGTLGALAFLTFAIILVVRLWALSNRA